MAEQVDGAAQHPHHIALIQGAAGDHLIPAGTGGPGVHQPRELRLPPDREVDAGLFLLAAKFAPQPPQIVQGLLHQRWRREGTPEIGAVHLGGDRLQHCRQFGWIQFIEVTADQGQPEPQFVVAAQGSHGAAHLRGLQAVFPGQGPEVAQHVNKRQEGIPMAVGAEVEQPLVLFNLLFQFLPPPAMFLQLLAVAPAMGGM